MAAQLKMSKKKKKKKKKRVTIEEGAEGEDDFELRYNLANYDDEEEDGKKLCVVDCVFLSLSVHRLLDSLVVECWLQVREFPGLIPSQGPRHTKDVIKMVPVVPLFGTQH